MSAWQHFPVTDQDPSTLYIKKGSAEYTERLGWANTTQAAVDDAVTAGLVDKNVVSGVTWYNCEDMDEQFPGQIGYSPAGCSIWGSNG